MKIPTTLFLILFVSISLFAQTVEITPALRLVNEKQCNGYLCKIQLPAGKVSSYVKKELNDYGKNEGRRKTYAYFDAKVIGLTELASLFAQVEKTDKESSELWMGVLSADGQSHEEAEQMLYDLVLHIYLTEADKRIADAQRDYDRALSNGISLADKLQDNQAEKLKLESDLEKNEHEEEKLDRHIAHAKKKTERLKEALNNVLAQNSSLTAIEKAQAHYDDAVKDLEKLEKDYSNTLSQKQKLKAKLVENRADKQQFEAELNLNDKSLVQLKQVLEKTKEARKAIK